MKSVYLAILLTAFTGVNAASSSCAADACYRQVKATKFPARPTSSDCSKYQATPTASNVPAYASSCNEARYASACSCIGVVKPTSSPVSSITAPQCDPQAAVVGNAGGGGCSSNCYCNLDADGVHAYCDDTSNTGGDCSKDSDCDQGRFCDGGLGGTCAAGAMCSSTYVPA